MNVELIFDRPVVDPEKAEAEAKIVREAYRIFEQTEAGKTVLRDLIDSHLLIPSFSPDPYSTAYREGQRSVVLAILHLLEQLKGE